MLTLVGFSQKDSNQTTRPNIVFIFSDDHATNAISAYGGIFKDIAPTPNIDRIAKLVLVRCRLVRCLCWSSFLSSALVRCR